MLYQKQEWLRATRSIRAQPDLQGKPEADEPLTTQSRRTGHSLFKNSIVV
jgi:hypothetical protein